ncbi:MAG TPA: chitin deacetylase family protein [Gemmatimonadales bacterium]|nr:chitin deacetylase family protein [Gemmatimonadales bacterium]
MTASDGDPSSTISPSRDSVHRAGVIGRRLGTGLIALLAVGLGAFGTTAPPHWLLARIERLWPGCLFHLRARDRVVALTIDDGPDPVTTPRILDLLRRHGARATFFLISGRISPGTAPVVRRLVAEGHEVGNHLTRDEPGIRLGPVGFERELRRADAVLSHFAPVRWVRPGSGWYSRPMIAAIRRRGGRCALGSVYPFDAQVPSPRFAARYVVGNVRPGSIVILHDGGERGERTVRALGSILPALQRRGYRVLTLSEAAGLVSERAARAASGRTRSPVPLCGGVTTQPASRRRDGFPWPEVP